MPMMSTKTPKHAKGRFFGVSLKSRDETKEIIAIKAPQVLWAVAMPRILTANMAAELAIVHIQALIRP